jgi:hypothetical protein
MIEEPTKDHQPLMMRLMMWSVDLEDGLQLQEGMSSTVGLRSLPEATVG